MAGGSLVTSKASTSAEGACSSAKVLRSSGRAGSSSSGRAGSSSSGRAGSSSKKAGGDVGVTAVEQELISLQVLTSLYTASLRPQCPRPSQPLGPGGPPLQTLNKLFPKKNINELDTKI